ncbi:MAG: hypothetical protein E2O87_00605 [Bacteroidetes bacterium]|nr:MAG: hypothetical protein E2O87_00605 [Bacteroidota bacterium]
MRDSSKREKIFIGIGLLLIALGIILNEWLLVALLSPDGAIESSTRITIWLFNFSMILTGLSLIKYSNRIHAKLFREGGISLIMILAIGILLRIIVYIFLGPHNNDNHFGVVEFVAANGAFPTPDLFGQAYQPPLYYFIAAPLAMLGSPKIVQLLSLVFSIANLGLLYHLIKTTKLLGNMGARRHVLVLAGLLPQFVIFSNFVSNDSLAFLFGSFIFIQAFRYIDQPRRSNLLILALALGVALLVKGTFLAFLPVLIALVVVIQFRQKADLKHHLVALGMFASIALALGSYKYIENTVNYGKPFVGRDEMGHEWVALQQGTYQGLKSIVDVNVIKLARHPSLSEYTKHSLPLLLYGTFWYSHIPESNFQATRRYPLSLLPGAIYLLGVVPTLLIVLGAGTCLWRNKWPLESFKSPDTVFRLRLREAVVVLISLSILAVVVIWGLKHDAWGFFQGRMLFPAFFAIAIFLGIGYEVVCRWRPALGKLLNGLLFLTYALLSCYFIIEVGNHLV